MQKNIDVKFLKKVLTSSVSCVKLTELEETNCLKRGVVMNLRDAETEKEYIIKAIETDDEELNSFLFSLGCYIGEPITVISHLKGGCVVSVKDARYNIDNQLAEAILI